MVTANTTEITKEIKESYAFKTLLALKEQGIRYCLWKSVDRLVEGVEGKTDFDLLVDVKDEQKIKEFLKEEKWIALVAEKWRSYPGVVDYVKYDEKQKVLLHFHIHFKLVMGEERLKGLVLPLEELYLATAVEKEGIPHTDPALEFIVYIIRVAYKVSLRHYLAAIYWCFRKGLRPNALNKFISEYELLKSNCSQEAIESFLKHKELNFVPAVIIKDAYANIWSLDANKRRILREALNDFRRYGAFESIYRSYYLLIEKHIAGVGKTLEGSGVAFAFVGPDGCGKTTLINNLRKALWPHFKTSRIYLGGNRSTCGPVRLVYRLSVFPVLFVTRRVAGLLGMESKILVFKRAFYEVENYLIAREKGARYQRGLRALKRGQIVIFERFPIFPKWGDGLSEDRNVLFYGACKKIYEKIKLPPLIFCLRVSLEDALKRKADHDPKSLEEKVSDFDCFYEENRQELGLQVFANDLSLEEIQVEVMREIMRSISINRD